MSIANTVSGPLIIVRHGETDWNKLGRYQGKTDTDLSNTGIEQAKFNGSLIQELLHKADFEIKNIVSSPLLRATKTANILADILAKPVAKSEIDRPSMIVQPAFSELSIGRWEGLNSQQVKDRYYEERKSRKKDRWNFKPKGGESLSSRSKLIENALKKAEPDTLIVTHSGILRIVHHILGGYKKEEAAAKMFQHTGLFYWDCAKLHTIQNLTDLALTPQNNCAKVPQ